MAPSKVPTKSPKIFKASTAYSRSATAFVRLHPFLIKKVQDAIVAAIEKGEFSCRITIPKEGSRRLGVFLSRIGYSVVYAKGRKEDDNTSLKVSWLR